MAFAPGPAGPLPLDGGAAPFVDPIGGPVPVGGVGGFGIPGIGAGIGKNLNVDIGGGLFGGLPLGGIFGGFGGGVPYVPVTPLGALAGFKGDLVVPIVIIGTAIFLLLIVVLAVKFALAFKLSLLKSGKFRRDTADNTMGGGLPQEDELNSLAHMVLTAIQTQSCAQNMICELGILARERQGLASLLRILQTLVPTVLQGPLTILRDSAEGSFKCEVKYPCGGQSQSQQPEQQKKQ